MARMRAQDLGLFHFLLPLKVLGGLPYYRTDVGEDPAERASSGFAEEKERGQQVPAFRKSKVWIAWSAVMGLASLTYFGLGVWGLLQPRCPFSIDLVTVAIAGKINDLGDLVMLNLIVFYVIRNSPLLLRTISSLFVLFQDVQIPVGKVSSEAGLIALGLIALAAPLVIVVAQVFYADRTNFVLYLTTVYEVILVTALGFTLTFLNKWLTHLLVKVYEDIENVVGDSPPLPPRSIPTAAAREPADPRPDAPIYVLDQQPDEELSVAPRCHLTLESVLRAQRKAAMVIEVHNLMNEYFGFPVAMLMLHSIFTLILACFYLSFLPFFNTLDLVVSICYIVQPTFIIVLLCDMPQKLEDKRDEFRVKIRKLQYNADYKHLKSELRRLIVILHLSPSYNMSNLFTLARGCIVEILGFVATSVVILLQFKMSEEATTAHKRGTCSTLG